MAVVGIVGLGNLGTAMATVAADNGHRVVGWEYEQDIVAEINREHRNERYLPGVELPPGIAATSLLTEVLREAEVLFITLPSRYIADVMGGDTAAVAPDLPLVNMAKGVDADSGRTTMQLLRDLFPRNPLAMLAGASIANEIARRQFTAVVAASETPDLAARIAGLLANEHFAVAGSDDPQGVELGGVLKNIYALGMGIVDAYPQAGRNFNGAFITQSLAEMCQLAVALGGRSETLLQVPGIGDLITTAFSEDSHNRRLGTLLAEGHTVDSARAELGTLPEGYNTLRAALGLARRHDLQLPLAQLLWQLIHREVSAGEFFPRFADIVTQR